MPEINLGDDAIRGVKKYLIELLGKEDWCSARMVGSALETLVSAKQREPMLEMQRGMTKERFNPPPCETERR